MLDGWEDTWRDEQMSEGTGGGRLAEGIWGEWMGDACGFRRAEPLGFLS